jgi:uncharacterized protein YrzB (UPF0473 family)
MEANRDIGENQLQTLPEEVFNELDVIEEM